MVRPRRFSPGSYRKVSISQLSADDTGCVGIRHLQWQLHFAAPTTLRAAVIEADWVKDILTFTVESSRQPLISMKIIVISWDATATMFASVCFAWVAAVHLF